MPKKLMFFSLVFLLVTAIVLMATPGERQKATALTGGQSIQAPAARAACTMLKHNGSGAWYTEHIVAGWGFYTYFDPAAECAATPTYPFEITAFTFTLYDVASVGQVTVDVVAYAMANPDSICAGPGAELCRTTVTVSSFYVNTWTAVFPTPCCVNEPFFIGVEYTNGTEYSTPSVVMDNQTPDTCINWMRQPDGSFQEWYDFWGAPPVGYPLFWVYGNTLSPNCLPPCTWQPGDPYKMHYPQLPDEAGWDVNATQPMVLADDFECTWTGPIKDIHFWGSWKDDFEGVIYSFFLSIHEDIPADQSPTGYSMPGAILWEREVFEFTATPHDPSTLEGWYDPATGEILYNNHQAYFQYDICFNDPADWFYQDSGTTYWLNISAAVGDPNTVWGWKSTQDHWNDDAVWAYWDNLQWIDIWEPAPPLVNDFNIQIDPTGLLVGGSGGGAFGNGWYFYPEFEWWNIWFYDHPFDPTRRKFGNIDFDVTPYMAGQPSYLEVAVNWSTDTWSLEQPPTDSAPPLPGVLPESTYIGRQSLLVYQDPQGHFRLPYEIPDYNPEWVSVDVRGYNIAIPGGVIEHTCQGSLDLAFVITGNEAQPPDSGACCFDPTGLGINADCMYTTQTYCEQTLGGVFEGVGAPCTAPEACCLPDGSCLMADPLCCVNELGGTPQGAGSQCTQPEACCMPDGSCQMLDPVCCDDQGGTPQGAGSQCTQREACCMPDGSCQMLDPVCCDDQGGTPQGTGSQCTQAEACCMPDGSCQMLDPVCCDDQGGTPQGAGSQCTQAEACCMPDGSCQMLDPLCCDDQGGTPQGVGSQCTQAEACCMPDGSCQMLDPLCCVDQGGAPQGAGSQCTQPEACCMSDGTCRMLDPVCCDDQGGTPQGTGSTCAGTVACCMPDGTCRTVSSVCCDDLGGTPSPFGAPVCLGDLNGDGFDDACVIRDDLKWRQLPDLDITGMDVDASCPGYSGLCLVLSDDFYCAQSGPITEIHIFGSWFQDQFPGDPGQVRFVLSIHSDVPAGVDQPWSHPGELLWMHTFYPGSFAVRPYALEIDEGYFDPVQMFYLPIADHGCWEYIFVIPEDSQFVQTGSEQEPVVYWLDIQAYPEQPGISFFGWKTALDHWNDDAVWAEGLEPDIPPLTWQELRYPPGHPFMPQSIDLAFELYGGRPCDCNPGDANGDGAINIGDAVYLINFIFKGGPPPQPYPLCSGDANCDCAINIADAVYLINYIFKGGPPPCDCPTWLSICGPPLRK